MFESIYDYFFGYKPEPSLKRMEEAPDMKVDRKKDKEISYANHLGSLGLV